MRMYGTGGDTPTIVDIKNHDEDLYHLSLVHLGNGGAVHGFGMGRPYLEPIEGKRNLVGNGIVASIAARPLESHDPEKQPDFTSSIDFITPQGVVGSGLALIALSRSVERSVAMGHAEHEVPTWRRIYDLALSVVALDTDVRMQAHSNPSYMPDVSKKLELIPPKIPSQADDTIDVGLYVDEKNRIGIVPSNTTVEVGKIKFSSRERDSVVGLPIDEIFRRADWEVESAPFSGYLLRVLTGSTVHEIETDEVAVPDNVRHIASSYGLRT